MMNRLGGIGKWAPLNPREAMTTRTTLEHLQREIDRNPQDASAVNALGHAHLIRYEFDEAHAKFTRAIMLDPKAAQYQHNLGHTLLQAGHPSKAVAHFRASHELAPKHIEPLLHLATIRASEQGGNDEAIALYCSAIINGARKFPANSGLLKCLLRELSPHEALETARRMLPIDLAAECESILTDGLVEALLELGRFDELIEFCNQSATLASEVRDLALYSSHLAQRKIDAAEVFLNRLTATPLTPKVMVARLIHYRCMGDTIGATRFAHSLFSAITSFGRRFDAKPEWDGSPLQGKTILLTALGPIMGSGFGDVIQYARFWALPKELGARVVVTCAPKLKPLFASLNVDQIVAPFEPCPGFDVFFEPHYLQEVFGLDLPAISAFVPYISVAERDRAKWREKIARTSGLRVGVVWRSGRIHNKYGNRNIPLEKLKRLFSLPGIRFFSLQGTENINEADGLIGLTTSENSLTDLAAAISELDVILTVDTLFAHLAGAMGKTTLIMLPYFAFMPWLMDRTDSPLYPTARLFRQTQPGVWTNVISAVGRELEAIRDKTDLASI